MSMHPSKALSFFSLALILGVALASFVAVPLGWLALLAAVFFAWASLDPGKLFIVALGASFFFSGFFLTINAISEQGISSVKDGEEIRGRAYVAAVTQSSAQYQNVHLEFRELKEDGESLRLLARVSRLENFYLGQEISARCRVREAATEMGGFNYRMFLLKDGVDGMCAEAQLSLVEGDGDKSAAFLLNLVLDKLRKPLEVSLPQPEGGLAAGMLFGKTDNLSENTKEMFARTGLTHIMAVSGSNVTVVGQYFFVLALSLGMWRSRASWAAAAGVVLFVLMVGFPASAVRAGIMALLALWARSVGRLSGAWRSLVAACALMVALNPLILRYDAGFQLSVLATAGMISLNPVATFFAPKAKVKKFFWEIFAATFSAQLFVYPLIAYSFGSFSVVALLSNMLVLPFVPLAMAFSAVVSLSGAFSVLLGDLAAFLAYPLLHWEAQVATFLGSLNFASLDIAFAWPAMLVAYAVIFWATWRSRILILKKKEYVEEGIF
ncbi:MAG TPA: ComEC/Rec2 family competence protein [Candidatus Moranbacteria bacterium]|nr:ComEC/Rec2 family competence protein [Candidatus Moranbacteria bacterium]